MPYGPPAGSSALTRCSASVTRRLRTWSGSRCADERSSRFLSKDKRLRYRREEIAAIRRHGVKAFILARGSLRAAEQVGRFERNREAIVIACEDQGPFVYAVHADRIVQIFPA